MLKYKLIERQYIQANPFYHWPIHPNINEFTIFTFVILAENLVKSNSECVGKVSGIQMSSSLTKEPIKNRFSRCINIYIFVPN